MTRIPQTRLQLEAEPSYSEVCRERDPYLGLVEARLLLAPVELVRVSALAEIAIKNNVQRTRAKQCRRGR